MENISFYVKSHRAGIMTNRKRVAVIGAGICGLFSVKHLKEEGIEPVCFERTDTHGGTWHYREKSVYGQGSLMPTTVINHSKESGTISDFPPRKEYHNHMKHFQVLQYFTEYLEHNNLGQYIRFNMEVTSVKKAEDYTSSGKWYVTVKNLISEMVSTELYDGVIVATGHINMPKETYIPGREKFVGKILHTHCLKRVEEFSGQNVVVVGMGCSGLDAAVEISRVAKQVYISTESGTIVINRLGPNGYPMDYLLFRRYLIMLWNLLGCDIASWYFQTFYLDKGFDHRLYPVKPQYAVLSKDPALSDHIGHKLLSGSVIQKPGVKYFTESGVMFEGDEHITHADSVIMATGYTWGYPFLEDGVISKDGEIIYLYKCMYPPHLQHPTLAVIGFFNPFGALFPLAELQSRWAAYLLAGHGKLPSQETMIKDIKKRHSINTKRYAPSEKQTVRVDYVQFSDEIAEEIGVKPNLLRYLFTDTVLFLRLLFGPSLPYQYRLDGHGKWDGARDALMSSEDRVVWPVRNSKPRKQGFIEYITEYLLNLLTFLIPKRI